MGCGPFEKLLNPNFVRTLGFAGMGGAAFVGVWCFLTCKITDLKLKVIMIYLPVFAAVGVCSELTCLPVLKKFEVLGSWIGKGLFYIFLGTLCLGSGLAGWIVGIYLILLGLAVLIIRAYRPNVFQDVGKDPKPRANITDTISNAASTASAARNALPAVSAELPTVHLQFGDKGGDDDEDPPMRYK
jgi:hypothetical protein